MKRKITDGAALDRRRRRVEAVSTAGLLVIACALVLPFALLGNAVALTVSMWVFAAGAVTYTAARMVNVNAEGDSVRLRRLRRMEMWAGFCFVVGAGFWFYNSLFKGVVALEDTVMFTLAGAVIQIVASWMIASRMKKESEGK